METKHQNKVSNIQLNKANNANKNQSESKNKDSNAIINETDINIDLVKNSSLVQPNNLNNSFNNNIEQKDEPIPSKKRGLSNSIIICLRKCNSLFKKDNIRKFIKKHFLNKTELILFAINISSIIFYKIGLTPCERDTTECTIKKGLTFYFMVGICTAISAILYAIYIAITLFTRKHFFHYIYTIPIFTYFIMEYTGADSFDHGFYNSFGFIGVIIIVFPILLFFLIIIHLIRNKKYLMLSLIIGIYF